MLSVCIQQPTKPAAPFRFLFSASPPSRSAAGVAAGGEIGPFPSKSLLSRYLGAHRAIARSHERRRLRRRTSGERARREEEESAVVCGLRARPKAADRP